MTEKNSVIKYFLFCVIFNIFLHLLFFTLLFFHKIKTFGTIAFSRLKRNADTEFLVKSRVFSDEATSIGLILNDLNDLWQTKEVKISRASYLFKSLRLRSFRRIIGLMKWELLSKLRLTLSSPPSRTIGVFLRRKEFEDSMNLIVSPHKVVLRRIAINLWEISIDNF
jgi:hypothetical protein